jgi:hypothetical protein
MFDKCREYKKKTVSYTRKDKTKREIVVTRSHSVELYHLIRFLNNLVQTGFDSKLENRKTELAFSKNW